jgi:hypothetical protein
VLLVTEDNIFLRQIFRSLPGVRLFELAPSENLPRDPFDLYVFDGILPDTLPDGDLLLVNPPVGTDFFRLGAELESAEPLTVHPEDARVRNLNAYADTINLQKLRPLRGIEWGTVLVEKDGLPVIVAGEVDDRQVVILPFDARWPNTDWVLQPAWPILVAELTAWFSPPRVTDAAQSLSPGTPVTVRFIENAESATVTRPDGEQVTLNPTGSVGVFADTLQPGLYRVDLRREGDTIKSEQFAVNLFDALESRIAPQDSVMVGTTTLSGDVREETGRREFWPWVAGVGLALLAAEWWVYHRSLRRIPRVTLAGLRTTQAGQRRRWLALLDRWVRRRRNRRLTRS